MLSAIRRQRTMTFRVMLLVTFFLVVGNGPASATPKVQVMIPGSMARQLDEGWNAFTEKTDVVVEPIPFATWSELKEKLPVMVIGDIPPDVVYYDDGSQADLYHRGVLQPIEPFVTRDRFNLTVWPDPVINAYRFSGQLYSLPTAVSNWVTFYNADKLYAAGLGTLPTDWNSDAFTFQDMIIMARKLTRDVNSDGQIDEFGLSGFLGTGSIEAIHLWEVDWYDDDQTEFVGNRPRNIEAISDLRRLYEAGVIGGSWIQGTAAMMTQQPYYLNTLATTMSSGGLFSWSIGVLPKAVGRRTGAGFHSLGMAIDAVNPEGAWQFIKFMTTDPIGASHFARAENRTPLAPRPIVDFARRWETLNPGMNAHVFTTGFDHVLRTNGFGLPADFYQMIASSMQRVMRMQQDPKGAMDALKPVIDSMLREVRSWGH